jgi:hypothetical protein
METFEKRFQKEMYVVLHKRKNRCQYTRQITSCLQTICEWLKRTVEPVGNPFMVSVIHDDTKYFE